jgi:hypothetical protein
MKFSLILFTLTAVLAIPIPNARRLQKRQEEQQVVIEEVSKEDIEFLKGIRFF